VDHLDLGDLHRRPLGAAIPRSTLDRSVTGSAWRRAMLVVSIAALVRLIFAAIIPLLPDETYYWEWSRNLAPGYFDHPGGIAIAIRLAGLLLAPFDASATLVGVRLGPILCGWIAGVAAIAMARRLSGDDASLRAAITLSVMPLAAAGLILATPDAPLLAATAVGLYCVMRALESEIGSRASLRWWVLTGLALGAAFTSKYTSIFLPVGVFLAILLRPSLRARLREPGPYAACAVATLVFLPVLLWNAQHDWISFLFQIKHGLAKPEGSALRAAWRHEGDFFGGQAGLASPILFIMLIVATWRSFRDRSDARFVLAVVATTTFGFFTYSAIRQRVEPNWPSPAYIPAIVLLATTQWGGTATKWLRGGVVFAAVISLVIYAQGIAPVLPLKPSKDPIARAFGWDEVARLAARTAHDAETQTGKHTWLAGDRYQEASEIAFLLPAHPKTFATNLSGRTNQYALWPGFAQTAAEGDNLILVVDEVTDHQHEALAALIPHFQEFRSGPLAELRRGTGGVITSRRVWTLLGWRGTWPVAR
jgi:4-amino-4-deoxy-L-arabinose transferase-like glycosyltransferase